MRARRAELLAQVERLQRELGVHLTWTAFTLTGIVGVSTVSVQVVYECYRCRCSSGWVDGADPDLRVGPWHDKTCPLYHAAEGEGAGR